MDYWKNCNFGWPIFRRSYRRSKNYFRSSDTFRRKNGDEGTKSNQYKNIHDDWKSNNGSNLNSENSAYNPGAQICFRYEVPYDKENQSVKRGNTAKTVYKIMIGN